VKTGSERLRLTAALALTVVAQVAVASRLLHLQPWGLVPDLAVLAVAAVAVAGGRRMGAAFGFSAGVIMDLYLATPLGVTALAYTLVGQALGRSRGRSGPLSVARRGALASAGALVLLVAGAVVLAGQPTGALRDLAPRLVFAAVTGALLAPLVAAGLAPLVAPTRARQRQLALRRARALSPAAALARR
jgi:rod shape-determining protein MreD